jgi:hypothetical protein
MADHVDNHLPADRSTIHDFFSTTALVIDNQMKHARVNHFDITTYVPPRRTTSGMQLINPE